MSWQLKKRLAEKRCRKPSFLQILKHSNILLPTTRYLIPSGSLNNYLFASVIHQDFVTCIIYEKIYAHVLLFLRHRFSGMQ